MISKHFPGACDQQRSTPSQNYTDTRLVLSITLLSAGRGMSELEFRSPFRHGNFLEVECPDSIASSVRLPSLPSRLLRARTTTARQNVTIDEKLELSTSQSHADLDTASTAPAAAAIAIAMPITLSMPATRSSDTDAQGCYPTTHTRPRAITAEVQLHPGPKTWTS